MFHNCNFLQSVVDIGGSFKRLSSSSFRPWRFSYSTRSASDLEAPHESIQGDSTGSEEKDKFVNP